LPPEKNGLPMVLGNFNNEMQMSERDIMYKFLLDLRKDLSELKNVVYDMMQNREHYGNVAVNPSSIFNQTELNTVHHVAPVTPSVVQINPGTNIVQPGEYIDITEANMEPESLSLEQKEIELIKKSLDKHNGKRKKAAQELGISERTLYRKIKQYDLE
jgi:transcriptional regulator with PAS, ATPase and Fis domain